MILLSLDHQILGCARGTPCLCQGYPPRRPSPRGRCHRFRETVFNAHAAVAIVQVKVALEVVSQEAGIDPHLVQSFTVLRKRRRTYNQGEGKRSKLSQEYHRSLSRRRWGPCPGT